MEIFYYYEETDDCWYIKEHYGQARTLAKTAYYVACSISGLVLLISCGLCMNKLINIPFYPIYAVIITGEITFFIDGLEKNERKLRFAVRADESQRVTMYPLLRKPLRELFEDKLSAEGTTVNCSELSGNAIEEILVSLERNGGHVGRNYAAFMRKKWRAA